MCGFPGEPNQSTEGQGERQKKRMCQNGRSQDVEGSRQAKKGSEYGEHSMGLAHQEMVWWWETWGGLAAAALPSPWCLEKSSFGGWLDHSLSYQPSKHPPPEDLLLH